MNCPTCSASLETGQKFCIQCGANVTALTLPAPPAGPVPAAPPTTAIPATAPVSAPPTVAIAPIATPEQATAPPTVSAAIAPLAPAPSSVFERLPLAAPPSAALFDGAATWTGGWDAQPSVAETLTGVQPRVHTADQTTAGAAATPFTIMPATDVLAIPGRRSTLLAAVAAVSGIAVVIGALFPILTIETDAPTSFAGDYKINDFTSLGTGVLVGFVFAAVCLIAGGLMATRGKRIGAGVAAGAGLAIIPVAIILWGTVDLVSKQGEADAFAAAAAGAGGTFYRARQDVGLFVVLGAAVVGLVALAVSLVQSGNDGRPRLNLALGVVGAMASLVAAGAQMIPANGATFSDNFHTEHSSAAVVGGRLALIAVVALAGGLGFLRSNRWGVGLAIGGASIWIWQWLSSLATLGDKPAVPGFLSFATNDKPNVVTTIGVIVMLLTAIVAMATAPKSHFV